MLCRRRSGVCSRVLTAVHSSELVVMPDGADFENLSLAGFAASAVEKLRAQARGEGAERNQAADALALLVRLVGRAP